MIKAMVLRDGVLISSEPFVYFTFPGKRAGTTRFVKVYRDLTGCVLAYASSCCNDRLLDYREATITEVLTKFTPQELMDAVGAGRR